jgi:hypothetical protein
MVLWRLGNPGCPDKAFYHFDVCLGVTVLFHYWPGQFHTAFLMFPGGNGKPDIMEERPAARTAIAGNSLIGMASG